VTALRCHWSSTEQVSRAGALHFDQRQAQHAFEELLAQLREDALAQEVTTASSEEGKPGVEIDETKRIPT